MSKIVLMVLVVFFLSNCTSNKKTYSCYDESSKQVYSKATIDKKVNVLLNRCKKLSAKSDTYPEIEGSVTYFRERAEKYGDIYSYLIHNICLDDSLAKVERLLSSIESDIERVNEMLSYIEEKENSRGINGTSIEEVNYYLSKASREDVDIDYPVVRFDYPPPVPTSKYLFNRSDVDFNLDTLSLIELSAWLKRNLNSVGHEELSYHYTKDVGVWVVSKAERFLPDGSPYPSKGRFNPESYRKASTFTEYFKNLFIDPSGNYRVFLFLISSADHIDFGSAPFKENEFSGLIDHGLMSLPKEVIDFEQDNLKLYLLVYEFKKSKYGGNSFIQNSAISAKRHLQQLNFFGNE